MPTDRALATSLASISARAARLKRKVELRPSAGIAARTKLAKLVGRGRSLPADLVTWFGHHDGQPILADGLDPGAPAMMWMSIAESLETWRFLSAEDADIMLPWSKDWLPLVTNGGNDYLVYVLRGHHAGKLLFYLHDAKRRPVKARSLSAFAEGIDQRLEALERSRQPKKRA